MTHSSWSCHICIFSSLGFALFLLKLPDERAFWNLGLDVVHVVHDKPSKNKTSFTFGFWKNWRKRVFYFLIGKKGLYFQLVFCTIFSDIMTSEKTKGDLFIWLFWEVGPSSVSSASSLLERCMHLHSSRISFNFRNIFYNKVNKIKRRILFLLYHEFKWIACTAVAGFHHQWHQLKCFYSLIWLINIIIRLIDKTWHTTTPSLSRKLEAIQSKTFIKSSQFYRITAILYIDCRT